MRKLICTVFLCLLAIPVSAEEYDRDEWFTGWRDPDRNCLTVREELLIQFSKPEELVLGTDDLGREGCIVIKGLWLDPYDPDGKTYTDPSDLHIDHVVSLKEAWRSSRDTGVLDLTGDKRYFGQDKLNLLVVGAGHNMSKGDKDITEWLPPRKDFICPYLNIWINVKNKYKLDMDEQESKKLPEIWDENNC